MYVDNIKSVRISVNYVEAWAHNHSLKDNVYHYCSICHTPWLFLFWPLPLERELPEVGVVSFNSAQHPPQKPNSFLVSALVFHA